MTFLDISGETAVVTGAASGIGLAITQQLASAGASVAMLDIDGPQLEEQSATIASSEGVSISTHVVDVTRPSELRRVQSDIESRIGAVSIVVANAGVVTHSPALDVGEDEWDRVLDINLKGAFFTCQAFSSVMVARRRGSVVLTGSTWAIVGFENRAPYVASKAGVVGLTRALALEWAPAEVRVNSVCPIVVTTPMLTRQLADDYYRETMLSRIPLGRFAHPADVAKAVHFLCSSGASMITGQALLVDGGWTIQ